MNCARRLRSMRLKSAKTSTSTSWCRTTREHSVRWRSITMTSQEKTWSLSRLTKRSGSRSRPTQKLTLFMWEFLRKISSYWIRNLQKPRRWSKTLKTKSALWIRTKWPCATLRATTRTSKRRSRLSRRSVKSSTAIIRRLSRKKLKCTLNLNRPRPNWGIRPISRTKSWSRSWWCFRTSTKRRNSRFASFCSAATLTKTNSKRSARRWRKLSRPRIVSSGI